MYLISKMTAKDEMAAHLAMFPSKSTPEVHAALTNTTKLELWGTQFADDGPDYCELRFYNALGRALLTQRINGY